MRRGMNVLLGIVAPSPAQCNSASTRSMRYWS
jgi:hypothetical protein